MGYGWGIIGAQTANAPQDFLAELVAEQQAAQDRAMKVQAEQMKAEQTAADIRSKVESIGVNKQNAATQALLAETGAKKLQREADASEAERQQFDAMMADPTVPQDVKRLAGFNRGGVKMSMGDLRGPTATPTLRATAGGRYKWFTPGQDPVDTGESEPQRATGSVAKDPGAQFGVYLHPETGERLSMTVREGAEKGWAPTRMVTGQDREKYGRILQTENLIGDILSLGEKTGWKGIGGLWTGTMSHEAAKQMGIGEEDAMRLRSKIGNLRAAVQKERMGTAVTPTELKTMEGYMASIDADPALAKVQLQEYLDFVKQTRRNSYWMTPQEASDYRAKQQGGGDAVEELVRDPKTGKLVRKGG